MTSEVQCKIEPGSSDRCLTLPQKSVACQMVTRHIFPDPKSPWAQNVQTQRKIELKMTCIRYIGPKVSFFNFCECFFQLTSNSPITCSSEHFYFEWVNKISPAHSPGSERSAQYISVAQIIQHIIISNEWQRDLSYIWRESHCQPAFGQHCGLCLSRLVFARCLFLLTW